MRNETEISPWQRCAACVDCQWWTGWQCRQEGIGYRDCAAYGAHFVETVVAVDRLSSAAKYVVLEKGQTADDVAKRASQQPLTNAAAAVGPAQGLNLLTYFEQGKDGSDAEYNENNEYRNA